MKKQTIALLSLCLLTSQFAKSLDINQLPKPYSNIKELLSFNSHGWYDNQKYIAMLCKHNHVAKVIEVGSWLGKSTRDIASRLPANGYIYAVDTWLGSWEHDKMAPTLALLPTLYDQFLSNIIHAQLTHKIIPIKMTSAQAAIYLKSEIGNVDLIYLDAAHDTGSVLKDLNAYYPFIAGGHGILCGDDWGWDTVKTAVVIFATTHNLGIYYEKNFWFIKEENKFKIDGVTDQPESVWQVVKAS